MIPYVCTKFMKECRNLVTTIMMFGWLRDKQKKGFSFIQTAKLAESEGTLRASGMRPSSNPGPRAPQQVR